MKQRDTVERVLYNTRNGKFGIGVRVQFRDKFTHPAGEQFSDVYGIFFSDGRFEGYIVDDQSGFWVYVHNEALAECGVEDWGFL